MRDPPKCELIPTVYGSLTFVARFENVAYAMCCCPDWGTDPVLHRVFLGFGRSTKGTPTTLLDTKESLRGFTAVKDSGGQIKEPTSTTIPI